MKDLITLKGLITIILMVAMLWLPPAVTARPDPPPAAAACIVGFIAAAVGTVIVYGLYRMCQHIPAPDGEPPAEAPISELPGIGPPSYIHVMPSLKLRNQIFASAVSLQHRDVDRSDWQTDYTFIPTTSQIGGLAMIAYDSNGLPVMTNDVALTPINGESWGVLDFTGLPQSVTNSPSGRIFRLQGQ